MFFNRFERYKPIWNLHRPRMHLTCLNSPRCKPVRPFTIPPVIGFVPERFSNRVQVHWVRLRLRRRRRIVYVPCSLIFLIRSRNIAQWTSNSQNRPGKSSPPSNGFFDVQTYPYGEHFSLKLDSMGMFVPVHTQLPSMTYFISSPVFVVVVGKSCSRFVHSGFTQSTDRTVSTDHGTESSAKVSKNMCQQRSDILAVVLLCIDWWRIIRESSPSTWRITRSWRSMPWIRWTSMLWNRMIHFSSVIKLNCAGVRNISRRFGRKSRRSFTRRTARRPLFKRLLSTDNNSSLIINVGIRRRSSLPRWINTFHERSSRRKNPSRPVEHAFERPKHRNFHTTSNHSKYEQKPNGIGKTTGTSAVPRKDVRVYFNDPTVQKRLQFKSTMKQSSFHLKGFSVSNEQHREWQSCRRWGAWRCLSVYTFVDKKRIRREVRDKHHLPIITSHFLSTPVSALMRWLEGHLL